MFVIESLIHYQIPPALIMLLAAIVILWSPAIVSKLVTLIAPLLTLAYIWYIPTYQDGVNAARDGISLMGFDGLLPLYVHQYSHIFATVFSLAAFAGSLYALNQDRQKELAAAFLYAGGAIGVIFSGDLVSLFIYWELMAVGSSFVIFFGKNAASERAGMRYVLVHFLGGVLLMIGIIGYSQSTGSILITDPLELNHNLLNLHHISLFELSQWLILIGVLINAGVVPFNAWLPDAYPASSITGMVFLSAFTTKTAIFVLINLFAGNEILIYLGIFMVFYGIIYAIMENNIRRILAFSISNQVGFMMVGIGVGSALALNGVALHAFCHIVYKALLVMAAGSVMMMTGKSNCTDLGGLHRSMKITMGCCLIGALTVIALPFTSGFISKSMILSSTHKESYELLWYALLASSAGVLISAGFKFPWFVFFHKDSNLSPKDPPVNMIIAMSFLCLLCVIPGIFPQLLYALLPTEIEYNAFAHGHAFTQLQLILFSGTIFFLLLPLMKHHYTISLDSDWLIRRPILHLLKLADHFLFFIRGLFTKSITGLLQYFLQYMHYLHHSGKMITRVQPIAVSAIWTIVILLLYLLFYYLFDYQDVLGTIL